MDHQWRIGRYILGLKLNNANLKLLGVIAIDLKSKNFDLNIVLNLIKNMNITLLYI